MRVFIKETTVVLVDDNENSVSFSTDQLFEFFRILQASFRDNGSLVFETLEFTV